MTLTIAHYAAWAMMVGSLVILAAEYFNRGRQREVRKRRDDRHRALAQEIDKRARIVAREAEIVRATLKFGETK